MNVTEEAVEIVDAEPLNRKANRALYQARQKIHPQRAKGFYRRLKWWVMGVTLAIYYVTPWLRWDRGPDAPDQAVLVDMANRRFYFFTIEIWPHEFFFVAGMLVMAGIGLFLVTSVLGRAWCGYACPQTVWVDLFITIERYFEGDRNARIRLDAAPWTADKIAKRVGKHVVWLLVAISTGGAWIFYFADAPTLAVDLVTGNAATVAYATVAVLTATTYIFGGFMREQVCTYMCPWPRIQVAMMDEHALTVTYNDWRGEPRDRRAKRIRAKGGTIGDCVDCNACVAVCPMGIDIRDGQQLECITCALCIDACDNVMDKLGLEKGLISYATLEAYEHNMAVAGATLNPPRMDQRYSVPADAPNRVRDRAGRLVDAIRNTDWRTTLRPRTLAYFAIYAAIGVAMLIGLALRPRLELNIQHDRNPVFVRLSDGSIRNGYTVKVLNMRGEARRFQLRMDGLDGASMKLAGSDLDQSDALEVDVEADVLRSFKVFVTMDPGNDARATRPFRFIVEDIAGGETVDTDVRFDTPGG